MQVMAPFRVLRMGLLEAYHCMVLHGAYHCMGCMVLHAAIIAWDGTLYWDRHVACSPCTHHAEKPMLYACSSTIMRIAPSVVVYSR